MSAFDTKALTARVRGLFAGFTTGQKAMTAIALLAVLVGGGFFASWVSQPTYATLFSGLSATDASAITSKLTEAKEPYQLADGGQTILVPQADVYQQRITLSGQGLPASGGSGDGYSLLDNQSLTTSDFQQHVTYQRALEGELRKTIEAIDGVQAAVVHLAIPEQDVFATDAAKPTASVLVKTQPGTTLTSSQVESIVHLVSSAVPKLDPTQVTVADSAGHVLSAAGDAAGAGSALSDARAERTQAVSASTAAAVQSMLDKVVGPGHAVVRVDTDLNYDQQVTDRQEYLPNKPLLALSSTTSKETYKGSGTPVGGVLGPDNVTTTTGAGGANSYIKQQDERTNALGTIKTTTTSAPGQVRRMTVAVLLDQTVAGSTNTAQITSLVSAAAGVSAARGDVVTVGMMPFDTKAAAAAQKELDQAAADQRRSDLISIGKTVGLFVLLALALVLGIRRSRRVERTPVDIGELEAYPGGQTMALPASDAAALESAPDRGLAIAPPPHDPVADARVRARAEIGQLIEDKPDEVARLLRGWVADRRS